LAIPLTVELILIVAISGIIAICIYILYLVDKLISRIESLEQSVNISLSNQTAKPEDLAALKKTLSSVIDQINAINEVLESTGKDIDSTNVKISTSIGGLATISEKIDFIEEKVFENKNEMLKIYSEFSQLSRKIDQLEKDAELIAARQQLNGEF
jgi:chromosome segregation ATPase